MFSTRVAIPLLSLLLVFFFLLWFGVGWTEVEGAQATLPFSQGATRHIVAQDIK
jgi:hypothetical protein